jgi:hypothetical protein
MVDLRVLALSKNRIQTVPVLIKELRSLEVLLLDRNAIASIPSEIGDLESLVELDVSYNRITSLPDEICGMDSLRFIRIQENPRIRDLPKSMMNLRRLRYIQCDEALRADFTQYNHLDYNSVFPTEMRYKYLIGRMPAFKVSSFVCRPIPPFARLSVRLRLPMMPPPPPAPLRRCAVVSHAVRSPIARGACSPRRLRVVACARRSTCRSLAAALLHFVACVCTAGGRRGAAARRGPPRPASGRAARARAPSPRPCDAAPTVRIAQQRTARRSAPLRRRFSPAVLPSDSVRSACVRASAHRGWLRCRFYEERRVQQLLGAPERAEEASESQAQPRASVSVRARRTSTLARAPSVTPASGETGAVGAEGNAP